MSRPEEAKDHYSTLGASEDASREEIERLYKRLAVRHHPDRGGDEEEMKALNEAYGVLRDEGARRAYDAGRGRGTGGNGSAARAARAAWTPASSPGAQADALGGRIVGALVCLLAGLVLLLLVRFQYIWFLWPLAILAFFVILLGVWMAHAALSFAREASPPTHRARRLVWAQELAFWSCVAGGGYGVYLILSAA